MKIVFATNNEHKLSEIRSILGKSIEVLSLKDIGCDVDIPETGKTLEENALQKAQYVYDHYHLDCFADDTGLEVDALNGAPGVYSARYASLPDNPVSSGNTSIVSHDSEANMTRLLYELGNNNNRKARFRTVIALIQKKNVCPCGCTSIKEVHQFEGIVEGQIIRERRGGEGFGYDPIFQPDGYDNTFAELGMEIKNHISHRARATQKLADYLLKIFILLFTIHCSLFTASAQIGTWKNYLSYNDVQQICAAGDYLFVRASNGLYQYNQNDQSITTYDKINGLSDTNIKFIAWSKQAKRLIAVYADSNIDLVETNGNITNISAIYSKTMTEDKTVNHVFIYGKFAYLSTGFGIVKVDLAKAEISETYNLGENILGVDIINNNVWAYYRKVETENIFIVGSLSDNLIDPSNWKLNNDLPANAFAEDNSDYETYYPLVSTLSPGGPKYNYFGYLKFGNDRLYTCGGGTNNTHLPACIQVLKDGEWTIYQQDGITDITGINFLNMNCVDYDPQDPDHVFGGARSGVYEFRNGSFVKLYNDANSPIEPFDGRSKDYELIYGVKFDNQGNLWILNSQAPTQSIIEYTSSGSFVSYTKSELMRLENKSLGNLCNPIIDSKGYLWFVNNNWVVPSLYRYDTSNDNIITYSNFVNQDGTAITGMNGVSSVKEDKQGNMWIGTDVGLFLLEPSQVEADNPVYTQVKVPRNDGTNYADYLLSNVNITAICIDEGNRKWIGTNGDGVYLISADNMTQLQHFTVNNSNLLSNTIYSMAINDKTGEVYFGTDVGLCSFMSDATTINEEMTKDNVWAYPNPVTPDYSGLITVVGLTYNADVKIVSSNGALIAEGRSNGGSFTWDGKDKRGNEVASGIYMVVTATSDGKKGTVCKIAVIR